MSEAFAADAPATQATTASTAGAVQYDISAEKMMTDNLLILGALFFIFYFILIRPQQKRLKIHQGMLKNLAKGDKVLTSGGIIGSIVKFEGNDVVVLEIAQNIKVRVAKSAISEKVSEKAGAGESANDN